MAALNATRSASVSPPPPSGALSASSLSDAEMARAMAAGKALPAWFQTEEQANTDTVAGTMDRHAYVEQVSGPAIGSFAVSRSGSQVAVDHFPIVNGHLCGDVGSVGIFESIEAAFRGIAAWVDNTLRPEFLAA